MKLFDKKKQKFNLILTKQTAFAGIDQSTELFCSRSFQG
jgi:hypothetical protein